MKLSISMLGVVAAWAAAACGSTPVPPARVASTETAVQSARQAGADRVPAANAELKRAEDELGKAKTLIGEGDNKEAEAMLMRAESDAALAAALTREAQQKAVTEAAMQRVRSMSTPMLEPSSR